jgi:hypothetical protein
VTSHRPGVRDGVLVRLAELHARTAEIIRKDGQAPLLPKGIGQAIIAHFGIAAGPRVGALKDRLEQAVLDGHLSRTSLPEEYLAYLERTA